jgi:hypothetical protein
MNRFRSIVSATFALMVLLSSSSFLVNVHLCRGKVNSIALFAKAEACAMEKQVPPCHKHNAKPCCEDQTVVHEGDDFSWSSSVMTSAPALTAVISPAVIIAEIIPSVSFARTHFVEYSPPLPFTDLTVTFRTLLI